jgi:hypothetical protein
MRFTTFHSSSGLPRQFMLMKENSRLLDLVPFAGIRRIVAHRDAEAGLGGK